MLQQYHRLNMNEREEISLGLAQGKSRRDIAIILNRSPSTISREVFRNNYTYAGYRYRATRAQGMANEKPINPVSCVSSIPMND